MGIARDMASKQKQIAISEFFEKNKHFLGFDSLPRAIITAVKEAVDNSLDACEEARILPDIRIEIQKVEAVDDELILISQDNGPGIPSKSIENVFGKLLFGSRFHAIRQSRGQQGIGITGVVMYSQLTTGAKTHVISKVGGEATAVEVDIGIDTKRNKAVKSNQQRIHWIDENSGMDVEHGVRIKTRMKAKYQRGRQSVSQYLKMTGIVNPHAKITFVDPAGEVTIWARLTDTLPPIVSEIKPHPHGMHIGTLQRMLRDAEQRRLTSFLRQSFSGVSMRAAREICSIAELDETRKPKLLKGNDVDRLLTAFTSVRLLPPPTDCLSVIEDMLIKKGLSKAIDSRHVTTITRAPRVSLGNPFQIEIGLIHGGDLPADQPIQVLRFANRVPLMYQQGGCLLTKAIESVDWKKYGLDHPGGKGVPKGPATMLIHLASTNVQFTSEAKEAVADNEEVLEELRKGLMEVGRGLRGHLRKSAQRAKAKEKFELVNEILPAIHEKCCTLLQKPALDLAPVITRIMNAVFCEEGLEWDKEQKVYRPTILISNFTPRPRSYTILCRWPEREGGLLVENERGGRREAQGLWAWKLETLQPGKNTIIEFAVAGLAKGSWSETDVFFRGTGDIIGATRLDEKLLQEMKREEAKSIEVDSEEHSETEEWGSGLSARSTNSDPMRAVDPEVNLQKSDDAQVTETHQPQTTPAELPLDATEPETSTHSKSNPPVGIEQQTTSESSRQTKLFEGSEDA